MKYDIIFIKTGLNLLTLNLSNLMNFNAEFPSLMRFFLLKGYIRLGLFLHPRKSHAQNGRSDSIPGILTLPDVVHCKD